MLGLFSGNDLKSIADMLTRPNFNETEVTEYME